MFLSNAALRVEGQPMFKLLSRVKSMEAQGKKIIHFEIGDPDFDTPTHISKACCDAIYAGKTHYTDSMGVLDFRKIISEYVKNARGFTPDISQVLVAPSANSSIYNSVQCIANPGDEVIISDPCFPTYTSVLNLLGVCGVRVKLKEENEFSMSVDDIEKSITDKTKMIIINSPNNPTGSIIPRKVQEDIFKLAEKYNLYLYSDEVYDQLLYTEDNFYSPSIMDFCNERTIIANGFSKTYAMTGWRLGYVIGPRHLIEKMGLVVQTISSCVSPFIQEGGIAALTGDQKPVMDMREIYRKRRDLLVNGLNEISGISCLYPKGAFYVFPNITKTGMTSKAFADYILEKANVSLLPGTDFGASGEGYIRLCYATSENNIVEGLKRIKKAIKAL